MNEGRVSGISRISDLGMMDDVELERLCDAGMSNWLAEFVSLEVPDISLPELNSPSNMVQAISKLGKNKRAWSQRLSDLVLELYECATPEDRASMVCELTEFSKNCPWRYLRDSAAGWVDQAKTGG